MARIKSWRVLFLSQKRLKWKENVRHNLQEESGHGDDTGDTSTGHLGGGTSVGVGADGLVGGVGCDGRAGGGDLDLLPSLVFCDSRLFAFRSNGGLLTQVEEPVAGDTGVEAGTSAHEVTVVLLAAGASAHEAVDDGSAASSQVTAVVVVSAAGASSQDGSAQSVTTASQEVTVTSSVTVTVLAGAGV
jgi:hypothetical protein